MLKSDHILALDIGARSIKMGLFAPVKSGGVELLRYAVRSLESEISSEESRLSDIREAVIDIIKDQQLAPGPVLISVPGQAVFSRFVKLPPASRDKVLQIVRYEAQQNVPFPINEVVWDYQLIGSQEGEIDVMLAAIKAEIIEQLTDTVASTGLQPDLVDVAPMALYNAVRYNYSELPPCTLVIDIGARSTDLIFIEEGRVFSRSIPVGGNTITQQIMREFNLEYEDAEELKKAHAFVAFGGAYEAPSSEVADKVSKSVRTVMTRLHAEINRSINFYRTQQSGGQPTLGLLTGGSSIIAYADTFLKEKLQIEVDYLNPFLNVAVNEAIDAADIGSKAHLMGEVVGLALRRILACPIELNLMPEKIIQEKAFHRKEPFLIASMAVSLIILVVWCGYFLKLSSLGDTRLAKVSEEVRTLQGIDNRLKEREAAIAETEGKIEALAALPVQRNRWMELLKDIHGRIPRGMWITQLKPYGDAASSSPSEPFMPPPMGGMPGQDADPAARAEVPSIKALEIAGYGYVDEIGNDGVIRFRDTLRESPFFTADTDIERNPVPGRDDATIEFTVKLVLKNPIPL